MWMGQKTRAAAKRPALHTADAVSIPAPHMIPSPPGLISECRAKSKLELPGVPSATPCSKSAIVRD